MARARDSKSSAVTARLPYGEAFKQEGGSSQARVNANNQLTVVGTAADHRDGLVMRIKDDGGVAFANFSRFDVTGDNRGWSWGYNLTGQLGDVMRESAQAALSFARAYAARQGIEVDMGKEDLHIHLPSGAIKKDGPSAGVTMATALVSALTRVPVRKEVAMTGEITLRGKVLPIGGLKEKAIAALRARVKKVIIPEANKKDLAEIPANVKRRLKFVPVTDVDEVLNEALTRSPFREQKKPRSGKGRVAPPARLPVV